MIFPINRAWVVPAMLAGVSGLYAEDSWDSLLQNSPFGVSAPASAPATASAVAPEFRGYFSEAGEQYFSIYDSARKRSYWLRQDETAGVLTARRFDAGPQVLNVEFQGQTLSLPLKRATLQASVAPRPAVPGATYTIAAPQSDSREDGAETDELKQAEQNLALVRQQQAYEKRRKAAEERIRLVRAAREGGR